MLLRQIKGLKFPDECLVRAFFKSGLADRSGSVVEFGCENGNNLSLFVQYGWNATGVEIVESSVEDARVNFSLLSREGDVGASEFLAMDMLDFPTDRTWDAILFPSSLYYVPLESCLRMLSKLPKLIPPQGSFCYFRMRRPDDGRTRISSPMPDGRTRRIEGESTGEKGCTMTFWSPADFLAALEEHCRIEDKVVLECSFENLQSGRITYNSDFILWGRLFPR
jgi:SAM-dependent methyltransferase